MDFRTSPTAPVKHNSGASRLNDELERKFGIRFVLAVSAIMLLTGGIAAYASFDLVGTGQVSVTPPIVLAVFVSGQIGQQACSVSGGGASLSCPAVLVQQGGTETLTFSIKNTGTAEVALNILVIPDNSSVLSATPVSGSPTTLAVGNTGTYVYALLGLSSGNSGFTISVTPASLPPQG
jgi:hypothetical protein